MAGVVAAAVGVLAVVDLPTGGGAAVLMPGAVPSQVRGQCVQAGHRLASGRPVTSLVGEGVLSRAVGIGSPRAQKVKRVSAAACAEAEVERISRLVIRR